MKGLLAFLCISLLALNGIGQDLPDPKITFQNQIESSCSADFQIEKTVTDLDDEESQKAAPWVSLLDDEAKVVSSRLGLNRFRIAGTAEFNGYNLDIRDDRIKPLVKWCEKLFPDVSTEYAVPWAGLRPMMPNMLPRVGAGKQTGIFYNTGHGHLGWTLSAATAELAAEAVLAQSQSNSARAA